ncbi:MAG: SCP2 sterol-binding domain-containing protein [Chloroflexi bacterium]|nr:SCP2 sterol-binding domain-containing protein [Chloroflexota bacterium]
MSASLAEQIMKGMQSGFQSDKAAGIDAVVQFNLTGDGGGNYYLTIEDGKLDVQSGTAPSPKMTLTATAQDYLEIATGKLNPMAAFSSGKLKVGGDMMFAMKFSSFFGRSM